MLYLVSKMALSKLVHCNNTLDLGSIVKVNLLQSIAVLYMLHFKFNDPE